MTLSTARRQSQILELLDERGWLTVEEIARVFGVSAVTARHDLSILADTGRVSRARGGATAVPGTSSEPDFELRRRKYTTEKRAIGARAAQMLGKAQVIGLDASTTSYYLALELRPLSEIFVVTNGIKIAEALTSRPNISVVLLGGHVRPDALSIVGEVAEDQVRGNRIELAFFGARAFTPEYGLMDFAPDEARVKRAMASVAERVIGLFDHSKWGRLALMPPVVPTDRLAAIVTDRAPGEEAALEVSRAGVELVITSHDPAAPARDPRKSEGEV